METILIPTDSLEEIKLVQAFLQQHKIKGHVLTDGDKEDIVLGRLMEETDYEEVIDTNTFLYSARDKTVNGLTWKVDKFILFKYKGRIF